MIASVFFTGSSVSVILASISLPNYNPYVIGFLLNTLSCVIVHDSWIVSCINPTLRMRKQVRRGESALFTKVAQKAIGLEPKSPSPGLVFLMLCGAALCDLDASKLLFMISVLWKLFLQISGTLNFHKAVWNNRKRTELSGNLEIWVNFTFSSSGSWLVTKASSALQVISPLWDLSRLFQISCAYS